MVRQLASAHINQFNILQEPSQSKQLGQFFRVLTGLWLSEDYIANFHMYLEQLTPRFEKVFGQPTQKQEVIKVLYILRGIMRGLTGHKFFNLFFDWFYP
jgi:hypothetical protein